MPEYKTITLTPGEIKRCVDFSEESARTQQDIEFGQHDTKPRRVEEIARDNLIGKMAEVAVARMLREDFGLHIPINYEIYPRGEWDDCDIAINGWNVDIKSTRTGHWLLFERHKLCIRERGEKLPHTVFMCRTPWDRKTDKPIGTVELIGCISLHKLLDANNPCVIELRKGDFIPGTNARLQADNYGVEFENLSNNWKENITYMMKHNPPDVSKCHIPAFGRRVKPDA